MADQNLCDLSLHVKEFTDMVIENLDLMGDMAFTQKGEAERVSSEIMRGITFYIYFTGTAQGTYMLNMSEETALELTGCAPGNDEILSDGFLDEVLNTSVGAAIEQLKKHYGFLTFNPPVINWGITKFPAFDSRSIVIGSDSGDITCTFSVSKVGMDVTDKLLKTMKELRMKVKEVNKDSLTGLNSRKFFDEYVSNFTNHKNRDLSFVIIDLDDFKHINDGYGHAVGDKALKYVAQAILNSTRETDLPVRFGGDEFVLILEKTPKDGAGVVMRRIAKSLIHNPLILEDGTNVCITLSCGVAYIRETDAFEDLFKRADKNLYLAKEYGKNCIVIEGEKLSK